MTVSVALNAELYKPTNADRKAIGMSLLLRHAGGRWLAEAEVGWTGEKVGWNQFDSNEAQAKSIEEIVSLVPPLVKWMDAKFRTEVAKIPR